MSLLWRFSITTNPWLKGHDIGPHAEKLRKLLLVSDPAEPWRYGSMIMAVLVNKEHVPALMVPPTKTKIEGHWCTRLVVGGFLLNYIVSSHPPSANFKNVLLQEDGTFLFSKHELLDIPFLAEIAMAAASHEQETHG